MPHNGPRRQLPALPTMSTPSERLLVRQQYPEKWNLRGPGAQGWQDLDDAARKKILAMGGGIDEKRKLEIAVGEAGRWQTSENSLLFGGRAFDAATMAPRVVAV
eukprot:COSAG05_NODE_12515_length_465_cov_0.622951_1_plen_103_part_01